MRNGAMTGAMKKARANAQHSEYSGDMETLFAQIDSITDNERKPTYEDGNELTQWKIPEPPQDATEKVTIPGAEK